MFKLTTSKTILKNNFIPIKKAQIKKLRYRKIFQYHCFKLLVCSCVIALHCSFTAVCLFYIIHLQLCNCFTLFICSCVISLYYSSVAMLFLHYLSTTLLCVWLLCNIQLYFCVCFTLFKYNFMFLHLQLCDCFTLFICSYVIFYTIFLKLCGCFVIFKCIFVFALHYSSVFAVKRVLDSYVASDIVYLTISNVIVL